MASCYQLMAPCGLPAAGTRPATVSHSPTLVPLAGSLFLGAAVCELISSGGFYFFSGRFAETSLIEFGLRLAKYFPPSLASLAFWMGIAIVVHIVFTLPGSNFIRTRHQRAD
jgi:hypothetical protein